ncbi:MULTISPECIES: hypothetical protein [Flavobacteriaceae]|uniref:hypothetical protein n=1 Tax=Flavobacteriaceae TaxID=49546 RepID=UPI00205ABEEC|nr:MULTISPECIES: hypothetical protein [Flavobacteriaceae]MCX7552104.1 hypothetical protein [Xanthomarina sp. F2636L]UPS92086.1 hypothetical protein GMA17_10290 [Bizionia sp. M204]
MNNKLAFLLILLTFGLNSCDNLTPKESFDKVVYDEYHYKYEGIIIDKYIDKQNHATPIIIIRNEIFGDYKKDFIFQSSDFFDFFKVGDTISKKRKSLLINIKRKDLDTLMKLDFGKFKRNEKYYSENKYINELE